MRRQKRRRSVLVFASHHRHCHSGLGRVLEIRLVSPSEHTFHVRRQTVEPELHLQVGKAVTGRYLIAVYPVVFLRHRNHIHRNLNHLRDGDGDAVSAGSSLHCDQLSAFPLRRVAFGDGDFVAVERESEMVDVVVPRGCRSGFEREGVGAEDNAEGLNPGVIPGSSLGTETDEAGVDLEVGVGYQAEMLVFLAVEVEHDSVSADEPRVQAC